MRNKPRIRFKGFTEDWEQRKLGEVVKSYSGGTPTASNKEYYGGDIPFIRSAEINSDTTELYITQKGLDNSSAKIVEKGTILYAMYGATSGEVGISKINGAINQAILAMIPLNYDGKIIAQYLRKNKESIIGKYLQGGQGNLSANIILEIPIQLPGLEESNQIAYFLESVDNIITLHQRKLEKLKLAKKALLQKLFPKNGSQFPEIRFKGFTDAWEQRKLGEVVKSYSGGTPTASNKEYYGGDIPFIRSAEINSDTTELYITQKGLDNSSAKIVEKGTILYAMYGATSGEVGISKINGAINQAILAMIPLNYDGKIIAQYLRKNKESIIGKYLQGGQGNLSANIILEIPIQLPGLEESNQIAYFLESVDNIITLHQRKLDKLQEVKKGLLQKMFV